MTTRISTKLAALAVALMINTTMIGGIAYLFNGQLHQRAAISASVQAGADSVVQASA